MSARANREASSRLGLAISMNLMCTCISSESPPVALQVSLRRIKQQKELIAMCFYMEHRYIEGVNKAYIPVRKPINGTGFRTCSAFRR
jgi:hypothetical protein